MTSRCTGSPGVFAALTALAAALAVAWSCPAYAGDSVWPEVSDGWPAQGRGAADAAVIVGIERYDALPAVPGALANARDWASYFIQSRGIRPSRVQVLEDGQAKDTAIRKAVQAMAREVQPRGTLWFVFIGHGAPLPSGREGALVTYDATADPDILYARSIPQSKLLAWLGAGRQAHTVVVLDACFSGRSTGTGGELAPGLMPVVPISLPRSVPRRSVVLTAGKSDQFAGLLPGLGRPAFSYLVLGGLRGWADRSPWGGNRDGDVTAGEALSYAGEVLAALRPVTGRAQEPQAVGGGLDVILSTGAEEGGPDVVALRESLSAALLTVSVVPGGATVSVDGRPLGEAPIVRRALAPGRHVVVAEAPGRAPQTRTVEAAGGEDVRLEFELGEPRALVATGPAKTEEVRRLEAVTEQDLDAEYADYGDSWSRKRGESFGRYLYEDAKDTYRPSGWGWVVVGGTGVPFMVLFLTAVIGTNNTESGWQWSDPLEINASIWGAAFIPSIVTMSILQARADRADRRERRLAPLFGSARAPEPSRGLRLTGLGLLRAPDGRGGPAGVTLQFAFP